MERTLAILKPDCVAEGNAGNVLAQLEAEGFRIIGLRRLRLNRAQAEAFYQVHCERPFFGELVDFMTSGPVVPVALERDDAVRQLRAVMGATDSKKAAAGTIRAKYGTDVQANAIHGSDSPDNARLELAFFFAQADLLAAQ